jgi:hypothetical protein
MPSIPSLDNLIAVINVPWLWPSIGLIAGAIAVSLIIKRYRQKQAKLAPVDKRAKLKAQLEQIISSERIIEKLGEIAESLNEEEQPLTDPELTKGTQLSNGQTWPLPPVGTIKYPQPVALQPGSVGIFGQPRKEALYDTESLTGAPNSGSNYNFFTSSPSEPKAPWQEAEDAENEEKSQEAEPGDRPSIISVPTCGPIAARPRREALFDRNLIPPTVEVVKFFENTREHPNRTSKDYLSDTNLVGNGGSIPRGHYFSAYSFSLVADASMPDHIYNEIHDKGVIRLMLGSTPYAHYPVRQCLTRDATREMINLTIPGKIKKPVPSASGTVMKDVAVPRIPISFAETENFGFELFLRGVQRSEDIGLMLILHGIYLKPLCG